MFLTHKSAETPIGPLLDKDLRSWRAIELDINAPWLWITAVLQQNAVSFTKSFMLHDPENISDLTEDYPNRIKKIDVQLVSPPWMNGTKNWLMEPVAEIATATIPDINYSVRVFDCLNGSQYVDSHEPCDIRTLQDRYVLFSFESHGPQ